MKVNRNDFFRQATMRICGSLDIETAMRSCFKYIETVMPVTGMALHLLDNLLVNLQTIALVMNNDEDIRVNKKISLPEEIRALFERKWAKTQMQEVVIVNRPESDPVTQFMANSAGKPNVAIMVMFLRMEDLRLGSLVIYADRKSRFTKEHARLLSVLFDPFSIAMSNALRHKEVLNFKDMLADDNRYLHQELLRISGDKIIGENGGLKGVMEKVRQVAPLNSPVLLLGETGTGKEVFANAIHYSSSRKHGPFIKVNCGALPESLMDSELFGHEKGAFTGALSLKRGRFERAHQGTIFLDEIGDLPLHAQSKLLRVLQSGEIERVGGSNSITVDVRIISATHRHLEDMVNSGQFREDLWFRLNVFPIMIPPLRQRKKDIPILVDHFIERKSKELKYQSIPVVAPGAIDRLKSYNWPGNVRELENVIERALIHNRGRRKDNPLAFDDLTLQQSNGEDLMPKNTEKYLLTLDELNSAYIQQVLNLSKGKVRGIDGAAERLGINPSTLRSRIKKLGIKYSRESHKDKRWDII